MTFDIPSSTVEQLEAKAYRLVRSINHQKAFLGAIEKELDSRAKENEKAQTDEPGDIPPQSE